MYYVYVDSVRAVEAEVDGTAILQSRMKNMESTIARLEHLLVQTSRNSRMQPAPVVQQPVVQPVMATGFMEQMRMMRELITVMLPPPPPPTVAPQPITEPTFNLDTIERLANMFHK